VKKITKILILAVISASLTTQEARPMEHVRKFFYTLGSIVSPALITLKWILYGKNKIQPSPVERRPYHPEYIYIEEEDGTVHKEIMIDRGYDHEEEEEGNESEQIEDDRLFAIAICEAQREEQEAINEQIEDDRKLAFLLKEQS